MLADDERLQVWYGVLFSGSPTPERPALPDPVRMLLDAGSDEQVIIQARVPLCWIRCYSDEPGMTGYGLAVGESVQTAALDGGPVRTGIAEDTAGNWISAVSHGLLQLGVPGIAAIDWYHTFQPAADAA